MAYSRIKCSVCSKCFGQEARFLEHVIGDHGLVPDEDLYAEWVLDGAEKPTCGCGCGSPVKWNCWKKGYSSKYLRGHNASVHTVFADPARAREFAQKRAEGYAAGKYAPWNKGLSAETNSSIAGMVARVSATVKKQFDDGKRGARSKGLTKETPQQVSERAHELRDKSSDVVPWNEEKSHAPAELQAGLTPNGTLSAGELSSRVRALDERFTLVSSLDGFAGVHKTKLTWRCNSCGAERAKSLHLTERSINGCSGCRPPAHGGQLEVYEFVKSIAPDAVLSDKSAIAPLQLGVYVPSKRFGIEYDNLYWCSEVAVSDSYADETVGACVAAGVKLLRIFEDEWRDRRACVEQMIKHRLGLTPRKVGARKCSVVELDPSVRKAFMSANHVEGDARSAAAFGLVYDGELVAAMSLRRPFHAVHSDWFEVGRFALAPDTSVPGSLSKLSKRALEWAHEKGKKGLMTYVDARIGQAEGYLAGGWTLVKETKARFWWTDFTHRLNRFAVKADKERGLTQEQASEIAGVVKIWGCRNRVLHLTHLRETGEAAA